MTKRATPNALVAAAAGLCVLLAAGASHAQYTIAPFTLNVKSKIYTFNPTTSLGGVLSCSACYVPGAVFGTASPTGTGTVNGGSFYGPFSALTPSGLSGPTTYSTYYFNPYWGAKMSPYITSTGGNNPRTPLGTLTTAQAFIQGVNPKGGPDFTVQPSQPALLGLSGTGSIPPGGNYLGTTSVFSATNGVFDVGSGKGPGTTTLSAVGGFAGVGKVYVTQGTVHDHGFGGTLDWLGSNTGVYLAKTSLADATPTPGCAQGGTPLLSTATLCYYRIPFVFPNVAAHPPTLSIGTNQWTDTTAFDKVAVGPLTTVTTPGGTATTAFTTFGATTGMVTMDQPSGSAHTTHTLTGSDTRTSKGQGGITLVTGWLGHTVINASPSHWGGSSTYKFTFPSVAATPSLANPTLGALGGLMAIAAVYVIRKRGSGN